MLPGWVHPHASMPYGLHSGHPPASTVDIPMMWGAEHTRGSHLSPYPDLVWIGYISQTSGLTHTGQPSPASLQICGKIKVGLPAPREEQPSQSKSKWDISCAEEKRSSQLSSLSSLFPSHCALPVLPRSTKSICWTHTLGKGMTSKVANFVGDATLFTVVKTWHMTKTRSHDTE